MIVFHTGSEEEAEREIAPFREWGSPLMVEIGPMPYPVMNTILDDGLSRRARSTTGSRASRTGFPTSSSTSPRSGSPPSRRRCRAILFEHFHGAVTRVGASEHRRAAPRGGLEPAAPAVWLDPADTAANIEWTRSTFAALKPHFSGGRWLNYLADDQGDDAIRAAYGPNYDRLVRGQAHATTRRTCSGSTTTSCPDAHRPMPGCPASAGRPGSPGRPGSALRQSV